jgi:hypothetical protein
VGIADGALLTSRECHHALTPEPITVAACRSHRAAGTPARNAPRRGSRSASVERRSLTHAGRRRRTIRSRIDHDGSTSTVASSTARLRNSIAGSERLGTANAESIALAAAAPGWLRCSSATKPAAFAFVARRQPGASRAISERFGHSGTLKDSITRPLLELQSLS